MINYLNSKYLVLLAAMFGTGGFLAFAIVLFSGSDRKLTSASIFLIAAVAIFTAAVKFHSEERDRAFRFLTEHAQNKELLDSIASIGFVNKLNGTIDESKAISVYTSKDKMDKKYLRKMFFVYNFFEEMAIGIKNNQINEEIVKEYYIGMLFRVYSNTSAFLPVVRNFPNLVKNHPFGEVMRPEIFVNVDWLFERWLPAYELFMPLGDNEYRAIWAK